MDRDAFFQGWGRGFRRGQSASCDALICSCAEGRAERRVEMIQSPGIKTESLAYLLRFDTVSLLFDAGRAVYVSLITAAACTRDITSGPWGVRAHSVEV